MQAAYRETRKIVYSESLRYVSTCDSLNRETVTIAIRETEVNMSRKVWSEPEIRALGVTTDAKTAFSVLGVGQVKGYEMVSAGTFPAPVLHLGRKYVVPVAGLLEALGIESGTATAA
ncbi:hypothetical protein SCD75_09645 [Prescottella equi]|nr:hypothetical protein SCD75_09645 [Prescottella equi]